MLVLWERGTLSVKELSQALRLDSGTLSPLLRRLEGAGLLTRERGAADERVIEATATEEGTRLRARVRDIPDRLLGAVDMPEDRAHEVIGDPRPDHPFRGDRHQRTPAPSPA
ncbi:hypothetical protein BJF83_19330 [Nocardiopsis sp. CNR-923]|nr:hypothetical protein BJF83_19330 [Nocardiopsis sp. CNR-923]